MNDLNGLSTSPSIVKRLIDLTGGSIGLLLLTPTLWIIVLLVKLDSPGPVLSRELRQGYRGRSFHMLRFRTTVRDGEEHPGSEDPATPSPARQRAGQHDSAHVTRLGEILRRLGLSEIPQLLNVIRGEMSLVGPCPLSVADSDRLRELDPRGYQEHINVMPGLTGAWQVARTADWNHCG